jgi:hypothetical protein
MTVLSGIGFSLWGWSLQGLILSSHAESPLEKVNDGEGRKTRALGGAGVSPAVFLHL